MPPTVALVVPVKFAPVKVIVVPPDVDPLIGEREEIVGALLKERAYSRRLGDPDPGLLTAFAVEMLTSPVAT